MLILFGLLFVLWLALQTPFFQNWLAHTAAARLSHNLGTKVRVHKAYIGWMNRVTLEGVFVGDKKNDTLVWVGKAQVNTTDWLLFKDSIDLKYIYLKDVLVSLQRKDSVWNYSFLSNAFGGSKTADTAKPKKEPGKSIALHLQEADIENLRFFQFDAWRGRFMVFSVAALHLQAHNFSLSGNDYNIDKIVLKSPVYKQLRKNGLWSSADSTAYYRRIDSLDKLRTFPESWNPGGMKLLVKRIDLQDGLVEIFDRHNRPYVRGEFDERDIVITPISGTLRNVSLQKDTLTALAAIKAKERSGLDIKHLFTTFRLHPQLMEFSNLDLELNNSRVGPYYSMRYRTLDDMEYFIDSVHIKARLENSKVSMSDIAFFAPELKGIQQVAQLTGSAEGTISNFIVNNVDLRTGKSRLTGTYAMKGLTDIEKTIISFDTKSSWVALEDVAVWAPDLLRLKKTPVANLGVVNYAGQFKGTVYDFLATGKITSDVGVFDAALTLKMIGASQGFSANIENADIDAGKFLDVPALGNMKFSGKASSKGFGANHPMAVEGRLKSVEYNNYNYQNILVDGVFEGTGLTANLASADPNLTANFTTVLDFSEKRQSYNARGAIAFADLNALKLTKDSIKVSGLFDVDFKGKSIDEFLGYARVYDAEVYDASQLLSIDSLNISAFRDESGTKTLKVNTNEAEISVSGDFNVRDLPNGFQQFLSSYYPSVIKPPAAVAKNQLLAFSVTTREVEPFLHFINPNLKGLNNTSLIGSLNTATRQLLVNLDLPYFEYNGIALTNTQVRANGGNDALLLTGSIANLQVNDSLGFPNANLYVNTVRDSTELRITTSSNGPLGNAAINAFFFGHKDGFEARFKESSFILNNKKWTLTSDGSIELKNGYLIANGVHLVNDNQEINMYTFPADEGNWNDVFVDVKDFNLGDVLPLFLKEPRTEGVLTGKIVVQDPLGKPVIEPDLAVNQFLFNNDSVGTVKVKGLVTTANNQMRFELDSRNPEYDFGAQVKLNLNDSVHNQIDANIQLRNERVSVLENYLTTVFDNIDGLATGDIHVVGKLANPSIVGEANLTSATMTVGYTKCTYSIDSARIRLGDNFIDFGAISLKDLKGRKGSMEGIMYHRFFDSLSFNMRLRTDGMQLLNTVAKDNDLFYGTAVGKGSFELNGPLKNLRMRIAGTTTDSSHIVIANKSGKESGDADFIVFKSYGKELVQEVDTNIMNMHIDIDLTANPFCKIDVIMDELTNDVIKATGSGNIKIKTGTLDPTEMRGRYQVEKGSYNYSFQTLIRKPFELEGGENNFIEWTGDPYDANLNVTATYTARDVSLRDLMSSDQSNTVLDESAQNYKGDVYVKANLKGKLSKPEISFSIEFPQGSPMRNNVTALEMLRKIDEDKSEMLRQVTYLIVFRSFAPYKEGLGSKNPGTELAVNTISDLLSSQMGKILTNVVQDITGDKSLNVDITTDFYNSSQLVGGNVSATSGYDRVNFNFMLNKSYFNNRVVVNLGSDFDVNVKSTTTTGFQFLPDVSVEFVLTPNRRLRAIVFKKDNLDYSGRRNRAGVSLSYRKEYEKFVSSKAEDALIFIRKNENE